ncbi:MAG: hypothetical protein IT233_05005 [Bacteroidia bacterium]|nr:hypothetical protein [Bacteroidia bacterium]
MKTIFLFLVLCPAVLLAGDTPNMGIGFRFGEPSGITFKKYLGESKAFEISFGRSYLWNGDGWYNSYFHNYYKKQYNWYWYSYSSYSRSFPFGLQANYLFHKPLYASEKYGDLSWYFGAGAQVRIQTIKYYYHYQETATSPILYSSDSYTNFDIGIDGVIGLEFNFKEVPLSVFTDAVMFMEVADQPFRFWWQGGSGIRYNF